MLKKWILFGLALIAIAGLYFMTRHHGAPPATRGNGVAEESLAPDFSLPDLTGQKLDLSSYRGKVVLLDFWATWCDLCRDEIPHFVELQNKYGSQGLQIIGVSMDDEPEPVRDFYQRFKMNYPVVMGNAKTGELYGGVLGLPIAFLVGRDGRISAKHIGATDVSVLEEEIKNAAVTVLPATQTCSHRRLDVDCFVFSFIRALQRSTPPSARMCRSDTYDTLLTTYGKLHPMRPSTPGFSFGKKICQWCRQHEAAQRGELADDAPQPVMRNPWARRAESTFSLTQIFFGINVAVFLGMVIGNGGNPLQDFPGMELVRWEANFGALTISGEWWRLLTCVFVHGGLLHIAFNMWCLWDLGALCESLYGRWTFGVLLYHLRSRRQSRQHSLERSGSERRRIRSHLRTRWSSHSSFQAG